MTRLTPDLAASFLRLTLGHLGRDYPYGWHGHVLNGPQDLRPPREVYPIFHGSFDWHSCVHGWWQVMRLARLFPDLPESRAAIARAGAMLVPEKVAGEIANFERPNMAGFERPYGWAWLLTLHGELVRHDAPWADALAAFARLIAGRTAAFLPRLTYPLRVGTHYNIAFAGILMRRWALAHEPVLAALIEARAMDWFAGDRDCQAWEPGGDEFLSPALVEAHLMSEILPRDAFAGWFAGFLPRLAEREPATLFTVPTVTDRTDGKIAHLDGLCLSRAWCMNAIAAALGAGHPLHTLLGETARAHLDAALPHLGEHYMGEHWLATFALLALDGL